MQKIIIFTTIILISNFTITFSGIAEIRSFPIRNLIHPRTNFNILGKFNVNFVPNRTSKANFIKNKFIFKALKLSCFGVSRLHV